ncbi:MAG: cysteine-rich small domain-containing protein [Filifactoraceae bacterium]
MNNDWKNKNYAFFSNKVCEAFPCHPVADRDNFNCLFCYCPLYFLEDECGGYFTYLQNGVKDCSQCGFPHGRDNYGLVVEKLFAAKTKKAMD